MFSDNEENPDQELLIFDQTDLKRNTQWRNAQEFVYKGFLYDLIKRERHGQKTYLYCWKDKKETGIEQDIATFLSKLFGFDDVDEDNEGEDESEIQFPELFIDRPSQLTANPYRENNVTLDQYTDLSSEIHFNPPSPPPELS